MNLPMITFLCGPRGVGKTTLANALFDTVSSLQAHSLYAPLFGAARGAFFDCDPGLDLTHEPEKHLIQGLRYYSGTPHVEGFVQLLHNFLDDTYESPVLGHLAANFARNATEFFDKVVFDDGDRSRIDDIRFVAKEFGEENCLIVNIHGTTDADLLRSNNIRCIDFYNNFASPAEMLTAFLTQLTNTTEPTDA